MEPKRLSRKTIYESSWVNLYLDKVQFPSGLGIEKFHMLDFPYPAVAAIVENTAGEVVFVQISRYTTGKTEWELPAGRAEAGETILETAEREVLEETGYTTDRHELVYTYYPMSGSGNKQYHIVQCQAGELVQAFDKNEVNQIKWFTRSQIIKMIREKDISDGLTLTALLLWLYRDSLCRDK